MTVIPPFLSPQDSVAIVSPAKAIDNSLLLNAKKYWESKGFNVLLGKNSAGEDNYFSGSKLQRAEDLQWALDHENVKAVICARGGYGCVHLIDLINWSAMLNTPKWLVGFSDVTVFHHQLAKLGLASVHGTMPLNYAENSEIAKQSVVDCLSGKNLNYSWKTEVSKPGRAEGELLGGNLAVLTHLIGTSVFSDYKDKILFLEEVGEYLYAIDRMFFQLEKSGVLDQISGVILGGFSSMKDTSPGFGEELNNLILSYFKYRNIPVAFNFPGGHIDDNRALPFGVNATFTVDGTEATLSIKKA